MVRSALFFYGGKGKIKNKIIQLIPPHETFIEVFSGSASVLLGKEPSKFEVLNDIACEIVDFFRCLQNEEETLKLFRLLWATPYSRTLFDEWRHKDYADIKELHEKAYRTFLIANQGHAGKIFSGVGYKVPFNNRPLHDFQSKIGVLSDVVERLNSVYIENKDFEWVISKYDGSDVCMYIDPPYYADTRCETGRKLYGKYEMSNQDHERLIGLVKNCKSKIILSGYENDLYNGLGWNKLELSVPCSLDLKDSKTRKTEIVWTNFKNEQ